MEARSAMFARRIMGAISGAKTEEKPDGSPWLRSVIRVPPGASSKAHRA